MRSKSLNPNALITRISAADVNYPIQSEDLDKSLLLFEFELLTPLTTKRILFTLEFTYSVKSMAFKL